MRYRTNSACDSGVTAVPAERAGMCDMPGQLSRCITPDRGISISEEAAGDEPNDMHLVYGSSRFINIHRR
ncbi:hypothetical protein GCM10027343_29010 [Noviherbaspirillum agri]